MGAVHNQTVRLLYASTETVIICKQTNMYAHAGQHWPVAIIGAGPTGLTLSTLLSQLGVEHVVFDRAASITKHPQVCLGHALHWYSFTAAAI